MIVDAPAGTTAAALGTGVTANNVAPDLTIDVDNNSKIVNNLNLNSQSGDATVANNTTAGNATTGDATASANVANIAGSQMGLSGWFGVLFINVFGKWFGSAGINTERGNQPVSTGGMGGVDTAAPATPAPASNQPFQFVADTARSAVKRVPFFGTVAADTNEPQAPIEEVETETEVKSVASTVTPPSSGIPDSQSQAPNEIDFLPFLAAAFVIGLGIVAVKNVVALLRARGVLA
jgi:hypothetical protein